MVETTTKKAQQLLKHCSQKATLLKRGLNGSPVRLILRESTLTKIHKPTPVGRPIISLCSWPTERISEFVDHLIQPTAQLQVSYLKDTTDFIDFIERIKLPKSAILVSMDVRQAYTQTYHKRGYYHCMLCIRRISPRKPSSSYQVFKRNA